MADTWKGKSRGTPLGYQIFIWILKNLGLGIAYFVLRFVALYFVFFSPKAFKANYFYFNKIHNYSWFKTIRSIYTNFYVFGQVILDKVAILAGLADRFTFDKELEVNLHQIADNNKGGILISAHLGSWEVAGSFLSNLSKPINIVMFDEEHEKIKDSLDDTIGERSFKIIAVKKDFSHIFKISNALKNKELICMHGDRFMENSKTLTADFMGKPAKFPLGPFQLATKFKVPYSFVYAVKESRKHYHFFSTPGKVNTGKPQDLLNSYVKSLEEKLKEYPLQWFNYYQFWDEKTSES